MLLIYMYNRNNITHYILVARCAIKCCTCQACRINQGFVDNSDIKKTAFFLLYSTSSLEHKSNEFLVQGMHDMQRCLGFRCQ